MTDPGREERIRRAADQFATALAWRIFGPPIIVSGGMALGLLALVVLIWVGVLK